MHARPHAPQFAGSCPGSTQRPWQQTPLAPFGVTPNAQLPPELPGAHWSGTQRLLWQAVPAGQDSPEPW